MGFDKGQERQNPIPIRSALISPQRGRSVKKPAVHPFCFGFRPRVPHQTQRPHLVGGGTRHSQLPSSWKSTSRNHMDERCPVFCLALMWFYPEAADELLIIIIILYSRSETAGGGGQTQPDLPPRWQAASYDHEVQPEGRWSL